MANKIKDKETVIKTRREKSTHYVDNEQFCIVITQYLKDKKRAIRDKETVPEIPDYIGECILKIATKLSNSPNFVNYAYKDEMISDGIENCFQYLDRFDSRISKNPFAYFTQMIWYAFIRRIEKEKKYLYVKYKSAQDMLDALDHQITERSYGSEQSNLNMNTFIDDYETKNAILNKKRKKKLKDKKVNIFDFFIEGTA